MSKSRSLKLILLLLSLIFHGVMGSTKCNLELIQSFRLQGVQYSVSDQMKICPTVFERCCSIFDELSILKYWNDFAETRLRILAQKSYLGFKTIALYSQQLNKFSETDIIVNYVDYRWMRFFHRNVENNAVNPRLNRRLMNLQFNAFLPGRGMVTKFVPRPGQVSFIMRVIVNARARAALMMYIAALARVAASHFENYENFQQWLLTESTINFRRLNKKSPENRRLLLQSFKKVMARELIQQKRNLEKRFENVVGELNKSEFGKTQITILQANYQGKFVQLLDRMKLFMNDLKLDDDTKRYFRQVRKSKEDISKELGAIELMLGGSIKKDRKLADQTNSNPTQDQIGEIYTQKTSRIGDSTEKKLNDSVSNKKVQRQKTRSDRVVKKNKKVNQVQHQSLQTRDARVKVVRHQTSLKKKHAKRRLQTDEQDEEDANAADHPHQSEPEVTQEDNPRWVVWAESIAPRFMRMYTRLMAFQLNLPNPNRIVQIPEVTLPLNLNHMVLRTRTTRRNFMRSLMITNIPKISFCFMIQDEFEAFNHGELLAEIAIYYSTNKEIMGLKKTVYCAVCDANTNRNFIKEFGLIIYEEEFCMDLIDTYQNYLMWKHVKLVRYFDLIYQYTSCLESDGRVTHFPYRSFLDRYKRRVDFFRRCLELASNRSESFMAACHFVCTDFKIQGVSQIWDADVRLIQNMLFLLFNFLRQQNFVPEDQIKAFQLLLETDLTFDDSSTLFSREVNFIPAPENPDDDHDPEDKRKKRELKDDSIKAYEKDIADLTISLKDLEIKADRNLNDQDKKIQNDEKRIKLAKVLQKAEKIKREFNSMPDDLEFNPISGVRPDMSSQSQKKGKRTAKGKRVKSVLKAAHITKVVSDLKGVPRKTKKVETSEEQLIKQMNQKSRKTKLVGRKLQEISKKPKRFTQLTIVAEPGFNANEIYEKRDKVYEVEHFRSFYTTAGLAFNPIRINNYLDFHNANITDLLLQKYRGIQSERISITALSAYLKIGEAIIEDFSRDLFVPILQMYGKTKGMAYQLDYQEEPLADEYLENNGDLVDGEKEVDDPEEDSDVDIENATLILEPGIQATFQLKDKNNKDWDEKLGIHIIQKEKKE